MSDALYMEIDLLALKDNINDIRVLTKKDIIAVIKSNAYGMGLINIARYLEKIDIKYVAVLNFEEAKRLLGIGLKFEILILNSIKKDDLACLENFNNLIITVSSINDARLLSGLQKKVKVHFKIDTGMNRFGFKNIEKFTDALKILEANNNIVIEGIYSHITDQGNLVKQENIFRNYLSLYPFKIIHLAATSSYKLSTIGNYVRLGADLYCNNARQVLKIKCHPLRINRLMSGEGLGYTRGYTSEKDELIAVLPIGYYNGLNRKLKGFYVLANGKRYKIVGNVCMNHMFVLVDEDVDLSTEFIITSNELPVSEIAEYLETIVHEVLCSFKVYDVRYYE